MGYAAALDGRKNSRLANHRFGCIKPIVNNGMITPYQLVSSPDFWTINSSLVMSFNGEVSPPGLHFACYNCFNMLEEQARKEKTAWTKTTWALNNSTLKWMFGILVLFWDGLFSGSMLVSGRVHPFASSHIVRKWFGCSITFSGLLVLLPFSEVVIGSIGNNRITIQHYPTVNRPRSLTYCWWKKSCTT